MRRGGGEASEGEEGGRVRGEGKNGWMERVGGGREGGKRKNG